MTKTIAVVADSHGNATALKAVLQDAEKNNATEVWSIGDIGFGGSSTEECFQMLEEVNTTQYLLGNWESVYNKIMNNGDQVDFDNPTNVYFANLVRYDQENFSPKRRKQIQNLPMTGKKVEQGLIFSLTHNLPTSNHGGTLFPYGDEASFNELNIGEDMDVAIYGHTHTPVWRYTTIGQMIFNPGSVGQPWYTRKKFMHDRDASYLLLTISGENIDNINFRKVPYDLNAELAHAKALGHPYLSLYKKLLTTGITSTHDKLTLDKINQKNHYKEKVNDFLSNLNH